MLERLLVSLVHDRTIHQQGKWRQLNAHLTWKIVPIHSSQKVSIHSFGEMPTSSRGRMSRRPNDGEESMRELPMRSFAPCLFVSAVCASLSSACAAEISNGVASLGFPTELPGTYPTIALAR